MKIHVDFDCTPEEARRLMGLPDLTPVHDAFVGTLVDTMTKGVRPELLESMTQNWLPMGEAGMSMWRRMFEAAGRAADG